MPSTSFKFHDLDTMTVFLPALLSMKGRAFSLFFIVYSLYQGFKEQAVKKKSKQISNLQFELINPIKLTIYNPFVVCINKSKFLQAHACSAFIE